MGKDIRRKKAKIILHENIKIKLALLLLALSLLCTLLLQFANIGASVRALLGLAAITLFGCAGMFAISFLNDMV